MLAAIAPVSALLLSAAILLMGNGLQGTLLPVRAQGEAFSSLDIGALGSAYYIGFGAGCFFAALLVRRAGHIRAFTAMVALASTMALVHALVLWPFVWWILRGITGFCFAVLYIVIESWLNEKATNENRGAVFSAYTIINLTVITMGQMMLTLASPEAFSLFAVCSILVSLAALPIAFTKAQAPRPVGVVKLRIGHLYRLSPVGVVGCLGVGLANGSFWALAPVYAQSDRQDATAVAIFMSIAVIAGACGQWPLGRLSDKVDRRKVIVLACFGAAAAGAAMAVSRHLGEELIFVLVFGFGLFAFPLYSLCVAHMNDFVEPEGYVEAASGLLLIFALGAAIGPILASSVVSIFGIDRLFAYTAAVNLLMMAFALYRMTRRQRAADDEKVSFTESILVSQTVSNVDPIASAVDDAEAGSKNENPGPPDAATRDNSSSTSTL